MANFCKGCRHAQWQKPHNTCVLCRAGDKYEAEPAHKSCTTCKHGTKPLTSRECIGCAQYLNDKVVWTKWVDLHAPDVRPKCSNCVHKLLAGSSEPCRDCVTNPSLPNFEPDLEPDEGLPERKGDCGDCLHFDVDLDEMPCCQCVGTWEHGSFTPKPEQYKGDCDDCMHQAVHPDDKPCRDCLGTGVHPSFEAKPTPPDFDEPEPSNTGIVDEDCEGCNDLKYGECTCMKKGTAFACACCSCPIEPPQPADPVNHPAHYCQGTIEPLDFIEANPHLGMHEANVIKYVCRHNLKNGLEDLRKARFYLDRLIRLKEQAQ